MSALFTDLALAAVAQEAAAKAAPRPCCTPQRVEEFRVVTRHRLGRQLDPLEKPLPATPETLNFPIDWTDGEIDLAMPQPHALLYRVRCTRCPTGYVGGEAWNARTLLTALIEGVCADCQREILSQQARATVARVLAAAGGAS